MSSIQIRPSKYNQGRRKVTRKDHGYALDEGIIVYRSSYELKAVDILTKLYKIGRIKQWWYEKDVFEYISSTDGTSHRYFMDFTVEMRDGRIIFIEVKPFHETKPPKKIRKTGKTSEQSILTYIKNQDKWKAVQEFVDSNNRRNGKSIYGFVIWTEKELGIGKQSHTTSYYKKKNGRKKKFTG